MPNQVLSLSFRPKTLDDLVGQKHMTRLIRKHMSSGRMPMAWMLSGETGCGKTTTARILALSLQCVHQKEGLFGTPCVDCQRKRSSFDIVEVNCGENSGVEETENVISGAMYTPRPPSKFRVFIFDEAQGLSTASQRALLKYFEDSPRSTVWVICTTEPGKILRTLRRRCLSYPIQSLSLKGVEVLVKRSIEFAGEKKSPEPIVEALLEAGVTSAGLVSMAVEKYLAGEDPEKAAMVGLDSTLNTLNICRAVVKGDWETVRHALFAANPEDARAIRGAMGGYLKAILLDSDSGKRAKEVADSIKELTAMTAVEDGLQLSGTVAVLYRLCQHFNGGGR